MTANNEQRDRSTPRREMAQGARARDARGRVHDTPALLHYGFRPFFLFGALHAALALPLWLWMFASGAELAGPFSGMAWHVHEMLFGYLAAVIAGFLLTAIPNWTGRLPLSGTPLAVLVVLWLAGRVANIAIGNVAVALVLDLLFPLALLAAIIREIVAGKNWRNGPIAVMFGLYALANLLHHLEAAGLPGGEHAVRLALGAAAMLIALIGGRITPSFTRNWLVKQRIAELPASPGRLDRLALAVTALAVLAWIFMPYGMPSAILLILAGIMLFLRLARWRGAATWPEPILLVLHAGYGWLALALALLGLSILSSDLVPSASAYHALTAGAVGTMTLAVMSRATLGHTGREIRADGWTQAIYLLVSAGALLRVAAPWLGDAYVAWVMTGGILWSLAFALFAVRYGPILISPARSRKSI